MAATCSRKLPDVNLNVGNYNIEENGCIGNKNNVSVTTTSVSKSFDEEDHPPQAPKVDSASVTSENSNGTVPICDPSNETVPKQELCEPAPIYNNPSSSVSLEHLDLRKEEDRLLSYQNWRIEFLDPAYLAAIGFFYVGRADKIRCFFCKVIIEKWEPNDNPLNEHLKWSPSCSLLRRRTTSNIPIDEDKLNNILPPLYFDTCGPGVSRTNNVIMKYPEYQYAPTRLGTFEAWPPALNQKPLDLADAGFFYTGNGDKVICFSCGTGLKDWEAEDVPIEEHARHSRNCQFLNFVKGEDYCQKIINKYNGIDSGLPINLDNSEETMDLDQLDTEKSCKICYENAAEVVFVPCGHVTTCKKCAFSMIKCPVCRENIKDKIKVFF